MSDSEEYGGEADQKEMADETVDVVGTVEPDNAALDIDAGPLYVSLVEGVTGGLRVIQDGNFLAISQGVDYPDGDRATVGHTLTPEEARDLAEMLEKAANDAEATPTSQKEPEADGQSFLRRLMP